MDIFICLLLYIVSWTNMTERMYVYMFWFKYFFGGLFPFFCFLFFCFLFFFFLIKNCFRTVAAPTQGLAGVCFDFFFICSFFDHFFFYIFLVVFIYPCTGILALSSTCTCDLSLHWVSHVHAQLPTSVCYCSHVSTLLFWYIFVVYTRVQVMCTRSFPAIFVVQALQRWNNCFVIHIYNF